MLINLNTTYKINYGCTNKTYLHVYTSTITDMVQVAEREDGKYPRLLQPQLQECGMCLVHVWWSALVKGCIFW